MTLNLGLGLGAAHRCAPANTVDTLYLAIGGDSLASRCLSTGGSNKATFIAEAEAYYGSGNVTIEGFSQGGLDTLKTWAQSNNPTATVYFWDDDTSSPSSKLTGLISSDITAPSAVNAVVLFLGANDANATLEASFGSTYTKAQYKAAFKELCEYLYTTAFSASKFIGIVPFHRNDQSAFAPQAYQAIIESQIEAAQEVPYIKLFPSIWDVDLNDTVHPTGEETEPADNAYQDHIAQRLIEAVSSHHKKTHGAKVGPVLLSASMKADHVLVDVHHDQGSDISVPANAAYGLRVDDDGESLVIGDVTKVSATRFKIDLPDQALDNGSSYSLYASYGQTESLSRTSAEVIVDNTAEALPLMQGAINVEDTDPVRMLTSLEIDINARAGAKTLSGSDVTDITGGANGIGATSSSGRYPQYDDTAFGGAGALYDPDGSTHMVTDSNHTAGSSCFMGMVVEFPSSPGASYDFLSFGTSGFGNTNARFQYTNIGELKYAQNSDNFFQTLVDDVEGQKAIILLNFTGADNVDCYYNSTDVTVSFDPRDSYNDKTRFWLFMRNTTLGSLQNFKFSRFFFKAGAHNTENDPTIAEIVSYLNDQYNIGLSL